MITYIEIIVYLSIPQKGVQYDRRVVTSLKLAADSCADLIYLLLLIFFPCEQCAKV